ncbi:MAG: AMP-binding protein [Actinomycetota bacterium]|nr:AMP-binding protein [Actinomycetota bacterium]
MIHRSGKGFILRIQDKVKAACIFCKNESDIDIQEIPRYILKDLFDYISDLEAAEPGPTSPDSMLEIVFTSGTTSRPKGVVINHKNIYANLQSVQPALDKWKWAFRLMLGFKLLSLVPLSHMYGQLIGIFVPLIIGGSVVYINMLNPARIIKAIKQYRVWAIGFTPDAGNFKGLCKQQIWA